MVIYRAPIMCQNCFRGDKDSALLELTEQAEANCEDEARERTETIGLIIL